MLILERQKALVLNLRNPERVLSVIPTARAFEHEGNHLVAVPHLLDEVMVLRNIGLKKIPSPILYDYNWPASGFAARPDQKDTAGFLTMNKRAFVLSEMGSGKTVACLWAADWLIQKRKIHKVLIVSTLSTLDSVWANEIMIHFPHRNCSVLHGTKKKRLQMLDLDVEYYIINHDGISSIEKELVARKDIDLIIIDEIAQGYRNTHERWKTMDRLVKSRDWAWGMTGSPTPNAPTDAWAQAKLLVPDRVPRYFSAFRDMVMQQFGQFKWLPRARATEVVFNALQPSIRYERDDIMTLPPCIYESRHAALEDDQLRMYKQMLAQLVASIGGNSITALNDAIAANKLLQIACGVVYDNLGNQVVIPCASRIKATREIIEESIAKVIVFAPYRGVVEMLAKTFGADYKVGMIHGGVPKSERDRIFHGLKHGGIDIIIAQPASMAHGLSLTEANTIIWYGPVYSNEIYEQAVARVKRPGQKHTQLVVHIGGTDLEKKVYKKLQERQRVQGLLLDMVKKDR